MKLLSNILSSIRRIFYADRHQHSFSIPVTVQGYRFLKCNHEGCNMHIPHPEDEERDRRETENLLKRAKELFEK